LEEESFEKKYFGLLYWQIKNEAYSFASVIVLEETANTFS